MRPLVQAVAIVALAAVAMSLHAGAVSAQSPQQVVLTAPLVDIEVDKDDPPPEGYNIDLTILNRGEETVEADVRLMEGPDGWKASLFKRVEGLIINRVMLPPGSRTTNLDFHFIVPAGTENGDYAFRLGLFDGQRLLSDIEYTVIVNIPPEARSATVSLADQVLPGGFEFETRFTNRTGRVGEAISFDVTLRSRDLKALRINLGADTPRGWQVAYKPSRQTAQVGAITLSGGGSESFNVEVVPPPHAEPGVHTVVLRGISEGLEPVEAPLLVELKGVPDLTLTTASGLLTAKVTAGAATDLTVMVVNSGDEAVDKVRFIADAPPNWTVTLGENPIPRVEAGAAVELNVNVMAPEETIPGDYNLRLLTVVGGETADLEFRITAVRSSSFGFIGVGVIVLVAGGLALLVVRLGRR
jgi:uncharacterized membrane protein